MGRAMKEEGHQAGGGAIPRAGNLIHDDLTDRLAEGGAPVALCWTPARPVVVLGRSNDAAREVDLEQARAEGVPIVRRKGGGGAVVLDLGTLCVTAAWPRPAPFAPLAAFRAIGDAILEALATLGIERLVIRGTGDLALDGRKLAGASLACGRGGLLYQMSLLVDPDFSRIARLLRHPSREPDYRRGREHGVFLTSLGREGFAIDPRALGEALAGACRTIRFGHMRPPSLPPPVERGEEENHPSRGDGFLPSPLDGEGPGVGLP